MRSLEVSDAEALEYVQAGGLISYGPSLAAQRRRAAYYVDKILKGAKPADLPVELPNYFELVIDAGARRLTVDEFKAELVQRPIAGQMPSGANLEIVYAKTGSIAGEAIIQGIGSQTLAGEWATDDNGRICTSIQFARSAHETLRRCEFWFKYKEQYFLSVSDSDRQARLVRRTIKQ